MHEFTTGTLLFGTFDGEINHQGPANDVGPWDKPPIAAVQAVITIIAHYKIVISRHYQFAIVDMAKNFAAPTAVNVAGIAGLVGKIIAISINKMLRMDHIIFVERLAVYIHRLVPQPYMVARRADHAFYQELRGVNREIKDNNVASVDWPVRQQPRAYALGKMYFIHQQKVSDQKGVLHGAGGNLEGLHNKSDDKDAEDYHGKKCLRPKQVARG